MKPNLNTLERYCRLTAGIVITSLASNKNVSGSFLGQALVSAIGGMKIAEGVTGWCPLTYVLQSMSKQTDSFREGEGNVSKSAQLST